MSADHPSNASGQSSGGGATTRIGEAPSCSGSHAQPTPFPWDALDEISRDQVDVGNRLVGWMNPGRSGQTARTGHPEGVGWRRAVTEVLDEVTGLSHSVVWRGLRVRRAGPRRRAGDGWHVSRLEWRRRPGVGAFCVSRGPVGVWLAEMMADRSDLAGLPAPLTPAESGVVTFLLCAVRRRLVEAGMMPSLEISVEPPREETLHRAIERGGGSVKLVWSIGVGDLTGSCEMICPLTWLDGEAGVSVGGGSTPKTGVGLSPETSAVGAVPLRFDVTAGDVQLEVGEFEQLRRGSVVVLDRHGVVGSRSEASSMRRGQSEAARLALDDDDFVSGAVVLAGSGRWGFRVEKGRVQMEKEGRDVGDGVTWSGFDGSDRGEEGDMSNEGEHFTEAGSEEAGSQDGKQQRSEAGEATPNPVAPTEMLERPMVDLQVRVGRAELSVGELSALEPGYVLELESRPGDPVELFANGRAVAKGELVTIEGYLGVRIRRVLG